MTTSLLPTADEVAASVPRLAERVERINNETGTINLRGPRLRRNRLSRAMAWFFRLPNRVEVQLDDVGTFVVNNMDGRTMNELADTLADWGKLSRREAETALTSFIKSLLQRRLIDLDGLPGASR